jgi:hypothetical protein
MQTGSWTNKNDEANACFFATFIANAKKKFSTPAFLTFVPKNNVGN